MSDNVSEVVHELSVALKRAEGARKAKILADLRSVGIRFHHFHDLNGRLVATICTQQVAPDAVRYAGCVVSPHEPVVSRDRARDIAYGRLLKGHSALLPLDDLKAAIRNRSIVAMIVGKTGSLIALGSRLLKRGIRPRADKPKKMRFPQDQVGAIGAPFDEELPVLLEETK